MTRLRWILLISLVALLASALAGVAQPRLGRAAAPPARKTATGTGAGSPGLSRSDADALYRDALKSAVDNAGDKAKALAGAAGLTLGGVQTMVEGSQAPIVWGAAKLDAGTPIEPGTQTIDASVTVT